MKRKKLEHLKIIPALTQDQTHKELSPAELKRIGDFFSLLIKIDLRLKRKEAAFKKEQSSIID